jgi:hypothetical protein
MDFHPVTSKPPQRILVIDFQMAPAVGIEPTTWSMQLIDYLGFMHFFAKWDLLG